MLTKLFRRLYRYTVLLTISLAVICTNGCAPMRSGQMSAQQMDNLKTKLGYIGLIGAYYTPNVNVKVPARNIAEGVKEGAKTPVQVAVGLLQGANCGSGEFCLAMLATGIALTPVGAIVGGVESAFSVDRTDILNVGEEKIKQSLVDMRMNEHIRDRFLSRLDNMQKFPAKVLPTDGSDNVQKPDYHSMKSYGIDTVGEISVQMLSLNGLGVVRPNLSVYLRTQVRLISTADNKELIAKIFTCQSNEFTFEEWATQEAHKFREEIARCYDVVAEKAVADLFVNNTLLGLNKTSQ